jgi:hypothetical protein
MDILNENTTQLLKFNFLCKIKEVARDWSIGWGFGSIWGAPTGYISLSGAFVFLVQIDLMYSIIKLIFSLEEMILPKRL